jgi:hypothetical protein
MKFKRYARRLYLRRDSVLTNKGNVVFYRIARKARVVSILKNQI